MGIIHASSILDEDLQVYRYISFVELVELLKFGQIHLEYANDCQRSRLLTVASAWRRSLSQIKTNNSVATKQARRRNQMLRAWHQGSLSFQTWKVLRGVDTLYWNTRSCSEQNIGIVSSIKNLAESLLVRNNTTVMIGKMEGLAKQGASISTSACCLAGNFTPPMPSEEVGIIANSDRNLQSDMSLHVVLSTLLSKVIVAPYVTERFFDLVAKLVRESTCATVTRINQLRFENLRPTIPRAYAPTVLMLEPVGCKPAC